MPIFRWFRLRSVVLVGPTAGLVAATVPTPIPQRFLQEIAHHGTPQRVGPSILDQDQDGLIASIDGTNRIQLSLAWLHSTTNRTVQNSAPAKLPVSEIFDATNIRTIARLSNQVWMATENSIVVNSNGSTQSLEWPKDQTIRQLAISRQHGLRVSSDHGLWAREGNQWNRVIARDEFGLDWAGSDVRGVAFDVSNHLWIACLAGVARHAGNQWTFFRPQDGVPFNDFTSVTAGTRGDMWFGTTRGLIRFDGSAWHYRQSRRWLIDDRVQQIAVDAQGIAWIRTPVGVSAIEFRPYTLQEKATHFEHEIDKYIRRTPWGYVAEARLRQPGVRDSANPDDSDNDGLWTSMYGSGECFSYAATRNPISRDRARRAFEALRFLQQVTQGGNPSASPGFIARTVRSTALPDPNIGQLAADREEKEKRDQLWKVYEPRWPKSADGKWFWKSDTSSDELDGHYFFYTLYFDLCAESEVEKDEIRKVVRGITDHLIDHDFNLVDHDGTPTRWGVYSPASLNHDPRWWAERGLNSLSMLAYLAAAEHITGNPKYPKAARKLIDQHGYAANLMHPKVQMGVGSGNHSDDEMAFMSFYVLLRCSKDEELKARARYSFYTYWALEEPELNPFFHFAYAGINGTARLKSQWGEFGLEPWAGWLEDSRSTLYGFPLDRLNWGHQNSHRLDLVRLIPQQSTDLYKPHAKHRGFGNQGKVLPVENRYFSHWNTDPWTLDYGGNGEELGAGTVFLLPYYMGLYHGFIEKP